MDSKPSVKSSASIFGIISLMIALITFLLILNWFFQITPYQKLEGLPLMITPVTGTIGFIFGAISTNISSNKLGRWGIISNVILFLLPWLYWILGTAIFGP